MNTSKKLISVEAQRILVILKIDSRRVFERIKYREQDYLSLFSMKRTRAHFPEIFRNKYEGVALKELMHCSEEVLVALDQFYSKIDEIKWYLNVTEDMPTRVSDKMHHFIKDLTRFYDLLMMYIDAELGIESNFKKPFEAEPEWPSEPNPFEIAKEDQSGSES